jgi:hypothetical protein
MLGSDTSCANRDRVAPHDIIGGPLRSSQCHAAWELVKLARERQGEREGVFALGGTLILKRYC